jgi:hypothetical protein
MGSAWGWLIAVVAGSAAGVAAGVAVAEAALK